MLCVLVEVNKTMYRNNEDVPQKLMSNYYSDARIHDVAFAVVWNVLTVDENKIVIQLSMN